jgi:hypothetical protein
MGATVRKAADDLKSSCGYKKAEDAESGSVSLFIAARAAGIFTEVTYGARQIRRSRGCAILAIQRYFHIVLPKTTYVGAARLPTWFHPPYLARLYR